MLTKIVKKTDVYRISRNLLVPALLLVMLITGPVMGDVNNTTSNPDFTVNVWGMIPGGFVSYRLSDYQDFEGYRRYRLTTDENVKGDYRNVYLLVREGADPSGLFVEPEKNLKFMIDGEIIYFASSITQKTEPEKGSMTKGVMFATNVIFRRAPFEVHIDKNVPAKTYYSYKKNEPASGRIDGSLYKKTIETEEEAFKIIGRAKYLLEKKFNAVVFFPVRITLVSEEFLKGKKEALGKNVEGYCKSPCNCSADSQAFHHHIYYLKGLPGDEFLGGAAHELTHAWQFENFPPREKEGMEGLAQWVEWKILTGEGFTSTGLKLFEIDDPVYQRGFRRVLELEKTMNYRKIPKYVMQPQSDTEAKKDEENKNPPEKTGGN